LVVVAAAHRALPPAEPDGDCDGTPFGHKQMWDCAVNVADKHFAGNKDGKIQPHEMRAVYDHFLSWWAKSAFSVAVGNLENHIEDCAPGPGQPVTHESFVAHKDKCFPKQSQRCRIKSYICDPAILELHTKIY
jgi:hypothetical protein